MSGITQLDTEFSWAMLTYALATKQALSRLSC